MTARRKARPLRDMRDPSYTYPEDPDASGKQWKPPAKAAWKQLASKHEFPNAEAAAERLGEIVFWWRFHLKSPKEATGKERREFLVTLADRADELDQAINLLGMNNWTWLYDAAKSMPEGAGLDLEQVQRGVRLLWRAARAASEQVSNSTAGRLVDVPLKELCAMLWRQYLQEFGPTAKKITRNADRFSGKFFDFAWDATRLIGINNSNDALGKAIVVAQKRVKTNNNRRSGKVTHAIITTRDHTGIVETTYTGRRSVTRGYYPTLKKVNRAK